MENPLYKKAIEEKFDNTNNENFENKSEDNFHKANFKKFLEYFRNKNLFSSASWNKLRETTSQQQQNRRKIILKEIEQLDSKVKYTKIIQGSFNYFK